MNSRIPSLTIGVLLFFSAGLQHSGAEPPALHTTLESELLEEGQHSWAALEARRRLTDQPSETSSRRILDATKPASVSTPRVTNRQSAAESFVGLWISLYRHQISPALGSRCSMVPNCSRYCLEAVRSYGWLGLTMYADRAIREPSVVQEARTPMPINGRIYYADPLSDHDFWLRHNRKNGQE